VEIAEGRFLERRKPITTTFDELAHAYLAYARENKRSWDRDMRSMKRLPTAFAGKRLPEITLVEIERYKTLSLTTMDRSGRHPNLRLSTANWPVSGRCSTLHGRHLSICRVEC
jgi:hypothetical protein